MPRTRPASATSVAPCGVLTDSITAVERPASARETALAPVSTHISGVGVDSNGPGGLGGADRYAAIGSGQPDPWSTPVSLTEVDSVANESRRSRSRDGATLPFGSSRSGSEPGADGRPSGDIYVSNRASVKRGHG